MSAPERRRGTILIAAAIAAGVALAAVYVALGGATYQPTPVADPCEPREWRSPADAEQAAEQFTLSALDGAACELRVTRERLALALASEEARAAFAAEHGIGDPEIEAALRAGLVRAIDDAERAGALSPLVAAPLRAAASRLPIEEAIALLRRAREIFERGEAILDLLPGQIGDALSDLLP